MHVSSLGDPSASRSAPTPSPRSLLLDETFFVSSVSRVHEARFSIGLPTMKRAPHMVPVGHETWRSRGCPRDTRDLTAQRGFAGEADLVAPVSRNFEIDRAPRFACAMKPNSSLRFPGTTKPTSLHGGPVRSAPTATTRFPEPTIRPRFKRGFCVDPRASPGFPSDARERYRVPAERIRCRHPVSRAEQRTHYTGRPCEPSSPRRSGCPERRRALHSTSCSSHDAGHLRPVSRARFPASLRAVRT
jgi:hypothetical protein